MGPPLPGPSDSNNSPPCHDDGHEYDSWCSPAAVPAPPSPYPPPPSPASHGRGTFVTALIIAISVLSFLFLCLSIFIFVRRRRQRRRREALLEAALGPAAAAAATFPDDDGPGGEEVVHHVWHIRTVGLDEAAIESIALTRYRAGAGGVLGASDCTVCLGEFQDGELLRLLPKCAHAFHVECIDTWLRAHVNCPLCRADVRMDPASAAAADADAEQAPAADAADASAEQSASNTRTMDQERRDQQANQHHELRVQIDQHDHDHPSSMELGRPHRQIRHPGVRAQNFRRVASMDSPSPLPLPPAASAEVAPEDEQLQSCDQKQGTGGAVSCDGEVSPEPGQLKRSLSASSRWTLLSRHCRARSSLLPL